MRTAYDSPAACVLLRDAFSDDELRQVRLVPEGVRLDRGAVYIDLRDPTRAEVTAPGGTRVAPGELVVPKADVENELWSRLTRPPGPGQTGG